MDYSDDPEAAIAFVIDDQSERPTSSLSNYPRERARELLKWSWLTWHPRLETLRQAMKALYDERYRIYELASEACGLPYTETNMATWNEYLGDDNQWNVLGNDAATTLAKETAMRSFRARALLQCIPEPEPSEPGALSAAMRLLEMFMPADEYLTLVHDWDPKRFSADFLQDIIADTTCEKLYKTYYKNVPDHWNDVRDQLLTYVRRQIRHIDQEQKTERQFVSKKGLFAFASDPTRPFSNRIRIITEWFLYAFYEEKGRWEDDVEEAKLRELRWLITFKHKSNIRRLLKRLGEAVNFSSDIADYEIDDSPGPVQYTEDYLMEPEDPETMDRS